jgi:hypothetical protein
MPKGPHELKPPKLTDAERLARFKDMGREVGASDKPEDFEKAFKAVAQPSRRPPAGAE